MKLEKGEKVFYMRVSFDKISEAGTQTIDSVEQVGNHIFITLDNNTYFQILPDEKEFPIFQVSGGGIYEFMTEDTQEGHKLVEQTLKQELGKVISQIGRLKSQREDLLTVLNNLRFN